MKKIVFVIESLHHGGAEKSLVTLLNNINLSNYQVDLILFKKGGEFESHLPKNITIIYNEATTKTSLYTRTKYWLEKIIHNRYHAAQLFWKTYANQITSQDKKYDLAIAYNQGFATYYVAVKIKAEKKYAWLNTDYIKAGYNANFDKVFYNKFDKVVTVSEEAKKNLLLAFKDLNLRTKITVIKDILDDVIIKKRATEKKNVFPLDNKINILTVGRLAKAKGYPLAIEACRLLLDKGYKVSWYVIGDGPKRKEIENLISKKNLQNHFHLLGYKENPYPYINECDLYVQASLFEGLGMSVIEATYLNKPIVITDFSTATSLIIHKQTGLICEKKSQSIATAIEQYIENPNLINKVINNLQKSVNKDKEVSLQKINELLQISDDVKN